jgi:hypothetical protein
MLVKTLAVRFFRPKRAGSSYPTVSAKASALPIGCELRRGAFVKTYRIYSVDSRGRIVGDREIEAENDEEAIFAARSLQRTLVTEVWSRDRRIGRVPPFTPADKATIQLGKGK